MNVHGSAWTLALGCVVFVAVAVSASAEGAMTVPVTGGQIVGRTYGSGAVFAGIPFAKPPVGPLRWQAPRAVEDWTGVRDATVPALDELQPDDGAWNHGMILNSSEDCLYLNVVTPRWPAGGKLPVIVFVHGGGNFAGGGWEHLAHGVTLQDSGVVVVTVNYRLGIFGFFAHPGLTAESPQHASGNYALQDLVAALRWVRANIATFGGDADNVTMMGQSAGALDICLLLACDDARGLFSKVIVESTPGLGAPHTPTLRQAEATGVSFAAKLGCADIGALRAVPARELLAAAEQSHLRGAINVDGWMLKEAPAAIFSSGRETRLPMLIGTNSRESSFKGTPGALRDLVAKQYGTMSARALALYGISGDSEPPADPVLGDAGAQYLTDTIFRSPTSLVAQWHAAAGAKVWLYLFSQTPKGREALGASHSSEMPYVFGEMNPGKRGVEFQAADRDLSLEMQRYWAHFAATGNPNGAALASWPSYDPEERSYLELTGSGNREAKRLRQDYFELFRDAFEAKLAR
jgi:para-nitrobenzyl esterase